MPATNLFSSLLCCLKGSVDPDRPDYLSPEKARAILVHITSVDFGFDVPRWQDWLVENNWPTGFKSDFQIEKKN
jgi:hypothetical protein